MCPSGHVSGVASRKAAPRPLPIHIFDYSSSKDRNSSYKVYFNAMVKGKMINHVGLLTEMTEQSIATRPQVRREGYHPEDGEK
jgi:hypothetical protein